MGGGLYRLLYQSPYRFFCNFRVPTLPRQVSAIRLVHRHAREPSIGPQGGVCYLTATSLGCPEDVHMIDFVVHKMVHKQS